MPHEFNSSYDEYKAILGRLRETGRLMSYQRALHMDSFIVLRHDVEFSLEKAVEMARIERECGVKATYFVQLESPAYNALTDISIRQITEIAGMGHAIGLHYREVPSLPRQTNEYRIWRQLSTLLNATGLKIASFSTHMPNDKTEYHRYNVREAINAYGKPFFSRFGDPSPEPVLYISDSELRWNYGYPDEETLRENRRIQILIHPYGWGQAQRTPAEVFADVAREKAAGIENCFRREFRPYAGIEA